MKKWIKRSELIYSLSFVLFTVSLFSTSKWTTYTKKQPLQVSKSGYQLEITRYPFSLDVTSSKSQKLSIKTIKLVDENNHIIPLDYLVESKKRHRRTYASSNDSNKETYSFIISSHMRKELMYRVTFKTKLDGINFSLFPMNNVTKKFAETKNLNLILYNNDLIKAEQNSVANGDKSIFFKSNIFTLNRIEDKSSRLKVSKFFNKIKLSSANNEMFFSLNFLGIPKPVNDTKISYQIKSLK